MTADRMSIETLRERVLGFYNGSPTAKALIRDLLAYAEAEHAARHDANRALDHERKKHSKATNRVAAATEYATAFSQAAYDAESDRTALLDVVRRLVNTATPFGNNPYSTGWTDGQMLRTTLADARALMKKMEGKR